MQKNLQCEPNWVDCLFSQNQTKPKQQQQKNPTKQKNPTNQPTIKHPQCSPEDFRRTQSPNFILFKMFRILDIQKTGKSYQFAKKKTINRCQLQNDPDYQDENFKATITTRLHKLKVNTLKMNRKIEILSRDRNYKNKVSETKNQWMFQWQNGNDSGKSQET